jgi:hypothetical protein
LMRLRQVGRQATNDPSPVNNLFIEIYFFQSRECLLTQ